MSLANADSRSASSTIGAGAAQRAAPLSGARAALQLWTIRVRVIAAVAIAWGGLYLVLDRNLLPVGAHRPATVLVGFGYPLAAVAMLVVVAAGAAVASLLVPRRDPRTVLLVVGLAFALWACGRGNTDDWLIANHPNVGSASGDAYWPLLAEYAWMLLILAGATVAAMLGAHRRNGLATSGSGTGAGAASEAGLLARLFGDTPAARREGPIALLVTSAVGALGLLLLSGPIAARTLRGQIYFAILIGFVFGVIAARQFCRNAGPGWFWAAPILTGVVGVVVAAFQPSLFLGAEYSQLNILPATGLVRPLPVELLGVGLIAISWGLHLAPGRADAEAHPE